MQYSWWQAFTVLVLYPKLPFASIVFAVIAICMTAYLRSIKMQATALSRLCTALTVASWLICILSLATLLGLPPRQKYTNEQLNEMSRVLWIPTIDALNNLNGTPTQEKREL